MMQPFRTILPNDAVLTGLHNIPARSSNAGEHRPLVILLHGGTYDSQYFDVDAKYGASFISNALGIPCVAPNRPGYQDSTSLYPIPSDSNFAQEYGRSLHLNILPTVWSEFGEPHGCNSVVLLCHSIATTGAIIAAGLYANESQPRYPLCGIICSGFGTQEGWMPSEPLQVGEDIPALFLLPGVKDKMLLQEGLADPVVHEHSHRLNHKTTVEEFKSIRDVWHPSWRELAAAVKVPVMWALAGRDTVWKANHEHLAEIVGAFTRSERVEGSIVLGAPHNIELSYWSHGWYARCFGFALECAASFARPKA